MSHETLFAAIATVVTCVLTVSGWAYWIGSKLATIAEQLRGLATWRMQIETDHRNLWLRLDEHGNRLDEHGRRIAEHGVQIDGIVSNCKEFRDRHHGSER